VADSDNRKVRYLLYLLLGLGLGLGLTLILTLTLTLTLTLALTLTRYAWCAEPTLPRRRRFGLGYP